MFAQQLADTAQHLAGHVLAYIPDPTPGPTDPEFPFGDPSAPHEPHFGRLAMYLFAVVGGVLLVVTSIIIMVKSGIKGDLSKGMTMTAGSFLGIFVGVMGFTGVLMGVGFYVSGKI